MVWVPERTFGSSSGSQQEKRPPREYTDWTWRSECREIMPPAQPPDITSNVGTKACEVVGLCEGGRRLWLLTSEARRVRRRTPLGRR